MLEHPKRVGDRSTLAVMLALASTGLDISVPFGENCRYDLVIDDGDRLLRVQCKTGRLRNGGVNFATCSTYAHHRSSLQARRDYQGQIDAFAVYCPETLAVYFVPLADVPVRNVAQLRTAPPKNGQSRRIRYAADYEIARVSSEPR
ncbi:MAG: group I intron-associated PD-(D/E)XK endonuclease [Gaiella sp.]